MNKDEVKLIRDMADHMRMTRADSRMSAFWFRLASFLDAEAGDLELAHGNLMMVDEPAAAQAALDLAVAYFARKPRSGSNS